MSARRGVGGACGAAASGSRIDVSRLTKELADVSGDKSWSISGVCAEVVGDNLSTWRGKLKGPADSPYEGGVWELDIALPPTYPFEPPKMRFITQIWHPNISSVTGAICLDILKGAWSPAMTIKTALLSISALLCAPEPTDPQDAEVAAQYLRNRAEYAATAKFWTETYASPKPAASEDDKVAQLVAMGFTADRAAAALREKGGDVERALEALFGAP